MELSSSDTSEHVIDSDDPLNATEKILDNEGEGVVPDASQMSWIRFQPVKPTMAVSVWNSVAYDLCFQTALEASLQRLIYAADILQTHCYCHPT